MRSVGKAGRPIEAWLSYYAKNAGAANTAFAFNYLLEPNLDASFADWQQVFSEMKVLSAEILWKVDATILPVVLPAQSANAALAYDPEFSSTSISAVNQVLEFEKFSLVSVPVYQPGTAFNGNNIVETTESGFRTFFCKVPNDPSQSETQPLLSTGMWRPTLDANNYFWGAFVGYCAQAGTTAVLQVEAFVRMRVAFKTRR